MAATPTITFRYSQSDLVQLAKEKQDLSGRRFSSHRFTYLYWYAIIPFVIAIAALMLDSLWKAIVLVTLYVIPTLMFQWWSRRKYVEEYRSDEFLALNAQGWTVQLLPEYCLVDGPGHQQKIFWAVIKEAVETQHYIHLVYSIRESLSIPKNAFAGDDASKTFKETAQIYIAQAANTKGG